MKKVKSQAVFKKVMFEQFKLPENFEKRLSIREEELENNKLNETGLKELIELYSVR